MWLYQHITNIHKLFWFQWSQFRKKNIKQENRNQWRHFYTLKKLECAHDWLSFTFLFFFSSTISFIHRARFVCDWIKMTDGHVCFLVLIIYYDYPWIVHKKTKKKNSNLPKNKNLVSKRRHPLFSSWINFSPSFLSHWKHLFCCFH